MGKCTTRWPRAIALLSVDRALERQALAVFEALDARPAADAVRRRRLHEAGVRGVARGARASTRSHPRGLTAAEVQVLRLLAAGLRNAQIADRLHRSVRTVDHHVASVLAKLGAASRQDAVKLAESHRWWGEPPQSGQSGAVRRTVLYLRQPLAGTPQPQAEDLFASLLCGPTGPLTSPHGRRQTTHQRHSLP